MSRSRFPARAILSTATLSALLLSTACSDATAPSAAERVAGDSPAQSPADTIRAPGQDVVPNHEPSEPPSLTQSGPRDPAASSIKPSFALLTGSNGSPGALKTYSGAVSCVGFGPGQGALINLKVPGVLVTSSNSYMNNYQYVIGEVFLYRLVGSTWVYQTYAQAEARLPYTAPVASVTQNIPLTALTSGLYRVTMRLTWYVWTGTTYIKVGWNTLDFAHAADYSVGGGTTAGPGYCRVS
jgi:hypothetical protein